MINTKQEKLALEINQWAEKIVKSGAGTEGLLTVMHEKMSVFKIILDTSTKSEMDYLAEKYLYFRQFALLLNDLAEAIADGRLRDLGI